MATHVSCLGCHTPANCAEMRNCLNASVYAAQAAQQLITLRATRTPATPGSRPLPAANPAPAAPPAPRGGGRALIWAHMDKIWEAAGKPTQASTVLALRKRCMDELEPQGVKRTSASSELGNWMKARCPQ